MYQRNHTNALSERVVFMTRPADLEAVDNWGVSAGMRSRGETLRTLVQRGLEASKEDAAQK